MKRWRYGVLLLVLLIFSGCTTTKHGAEPEEKVDYVIGVEKENAPYYFTDEKGDAAGIYVDLLKLLSEKEDFRYRLEEMTANDFLSGVYGEEPLLFLGAVDTDCAEQTVGSEVLFQSGLYVLKAKGSGLTRMEDLRDVTVVTRAKTGEEIFARYLAAKYSGDVLTFRGLETAVGDFSAGYSKALVMDSRSAIWQAERNPQMKLWKESEKYVNSHRFIMKEEGNIPEKIARGITAIKKDGSLESLLQTVYP